MDLPPQSARTHPEQDAAVPPPGDDIMSDAGGHPPSRSTCVRRQPARVLRPRAQKAPTRGSKKTSASLEGSLLRQRQEVGEHAGDENIDRLRAGRKRGMRHQEQQQRAARDPPRCSLSTSTSDTCPPAAAADMAESETPKVSIPSSPLVTIRPDTSAFEAAFECHARSLLVTEGASAVSSVTVGCASQVGSVSPDHSAEAKTDASLHQQGDLAVTMSPCRILKRTLSESEFRESEHPVLPLATTRSRTTSRRKTPQGRRRRVSRTATPSAAPATLTIVPGAQTARAVPRGAVVARSTGNERFAGIESVQKFQRAYRAMLAAGAKRRRATVELMVGGEPENLPLRGESGSAVAAAEAGPSSPPVPSASPLLRTAQKRDDDRRGDDRGDGASGECGAMIGDANAVDGEVQPQVALKEWLHEQQRQSITADALTAAIDAARAALLSSPPQLPPAVVASVRPDATDDDGSSKTEVEQVPPSRQLSIASIAVEPDDEPMVDATDITSFSLSSCSLSQIVNSPTSFLSGCKAALPQRFDDEDDGDTTASTSFSGAAFALPPPRPQTFILPPPSLPLPMSLTLDHHHPHRQPHRDIHVFLPGPALPPPPGAATIRPLPWATVWHSGPATAASAAAAPPPLPCPFAAGQSGSSAVHAMAVTGQSDTEPAPTRSGPGSGPAIHWMTTTTTNTTNISENSGGSASASATAGTTSSKGLMPPPNVLALCSPGQEGGHALPPFFHFDGAPGMASPLMPPSIPSVCEPAPHGERLASFLSATGLSSFRGGPHVSQGEDFRYMTSATRTSLILQAETDSRCDSEDLGNGSLHTPPREGAVGALASSGPAGCGAFGGVAMPCTSAWRVGLDWSSPPPSPFIA